MEYAPDLEKLNATMRAALETQLEVRLVRAALQHGTMNRLPGAREMWDNPSKEPTHCLCHPSGEAGYAVPISEMKKLMHMEEQAMLRYLGDTYPVIVPKASKDA